MVETKSGSRSSHDTSAAWRSSGGCQTDEELQMHTLLEEGNAKQKAEHRGDDLRPEGCRALENGR
jgi:hypothetical protein